MGRFFDRKGGHSPGKAFDFSDRCRATLAQARQEAIGLRHDHLGTEHLLLALAAETEGVGPAVLAALDVQPTEIREQVLARVRPGTTPPPPGEIRYTSGAKVVLERAMEAARGMNHTHVGTEHLLIGLLREEEGVAAEVLSVLGAPLDAVRAETLRLLRGEPRHDFRVEIDDASDLPIYEQIVAQVQEAVATERLPAGARLPAVRRLADDLEIAPGTVARAYAELERRGVVVTEGARGTRVAERRAAKLPEEERPEVLVGLLRPVAVAAFHLGATDRQLRDALEAAMAGIYG